MMQAVAWIFLGIFSLIRFQADYLLVVGVCLSLSVANIIGFTKCRKGKLFSLFGSYWQTPEFSKNQVFYPVSIICGLYDLENGFS